MYSASILLSIIEHIFKEGPSSSRICGEHVSCICFRALHLNCFAQYVCAWRGTIGGLGRSDRDVTPNQATPCRVAATWNTIQVTCLVYFVVIRPTTSLYYKFPYKPSRYENKATRLLLCKFLYGKKPIWITDARCRRNVPEITDISQILHV